MIIFFFVLPSLVFGFPELLPSFVNVNASDSTNTKYFGYSTAFAGPSADFLLVGAPYSTVNGSVQAGSAQLFSRRGPGDLPFSSPPLVFNASDDVEAEARFGDIVCISTDANIVVAGIPYHDGQSSTIHGAAMVFERASNAVPFTDPPTLLRLSHDDSLFFGISCAVSESAIFIGSTRAGQAENGEVEVFERLGSCAPDTWCFAHAIKPTLRYLGYFGRSISSDPSGNVVAIGVNEENVNGISKAGSVRIYSRPSSPTLDWTYETRLTTGELQERSYFGTDVKLDAMGETLVAGAYGYHLPNASFHGAAFAFDKIGGVWSDPIILLPPEDEAYERDDRCGIHVDIRADGNVIVVGCNQDDQQGHIDSGSAWIFQRSSKTDPWSSGQKVISRDISAYLHFGFSVSLSDDLLAVGVYRGGPSLVGTVEVMCSLNHTCPLDCCPSQPSSSEVPPCAGPPTPQPTASPTPSPPPPAALTSSPTPLFVQGAAPSIFVPDTLDSSSSTIASASSTVASSAADSSSADESSGASSDPISSEPSSMTIPLIGMGAALGLVTCIAVGSLLILCRSRSKKGARRLSLELSPASTSIGSGGRSSRRRSRRQSVSHHSRSRTSSVSSSATPLPAPSEYGNLRLTPSVASTDHEYMAFQNPSAGTFPPRRSYGVNGEASDQAYSPLPVQSPTAQGYVASPYSTMATAASDEPLTQGYQMAK